VRQGVSNTGLTTTAVHLESLLIGVNVELDAGPRARQGSNWSRCAPIEGAILVTVDDVAGIVARAVRSTVAVRLWSGKVGANLLGRGPEIIDRVLQVGKDGAVGDEDTVGSNALARVGHVEGVVEGKRRSWVCETVQIPVGLPALAKSSIHHTHSYVHEK
jgi:hypothetical protein